MKMGQNTANVRGQPQKEEGRGSRHKRKSLNGKQHKTPEGQEIYIFIYVKYI